MMNKENNKDRELFESAIRAFKAEIANIGTHLIVDSSARQAYSHQIKIMADELRKKAISGQITWAQAAKEANEARNLTMDIIRGRPRNR